MWGLRLFEYFVMALVLAVVVCFCIQLALIEDQSIGQVFRGYVPSSAVVQSQGYAFACLNYNRNTSLTRLKVCIKAAVSSEQQ